MLKATDTVVEILRQDISLQLPWGTLVGKPALSEVWCYLGSSFQMSYPLTYTGVDEAIDFLARTKEAILRPG